MKFRSAVIGSLAALLTLTSSVAAEAAPPDTSACIAAFDQGQRLKSDRKLRRAQTELLVCTQESCPAVLRADCAGVLRNVQAAIPTIVLAADDGEGRDITDVSVKSSDAPVAERLDGRAIEFDPGTYDFRFERSEKATPSGAPRAMTVHQVLREGEKNRVVRASFKSKLAATATIEPAPQRRPAGYVVPVALAVVGLAGLGTAIYSRVAFNSDVDDMRGRCAPDCSQSERADLSNTLVAANVAFGIGIGAVALAGLTWFLLAPRPPVRTATAGVWVW